MKDVQRELDETMGSLASLKNVNGAADEVLLTTRLRKKHKKHMEASDKIFLLHAQRLHAKQNKLIQILFEINNDLLDVLETFDSC